MDGKTIVVCNVMVRNGIVLRGLCECAPKVCVSDVHLENQLICRLIYLSSYTYLFIRPDKSWIYDVAMRIVYRTSENRSFKRFLKLLNGLCNEICFQIIRVYLYIIKIIITIVDSIFSCKCASSIFVFDPYLMNLEKLPC